MKFSKIISLFAALMTLPLTVTAQAQDLEPKEPRVRQLADAYGFVRGQQLLLELIEEKFPALSQDVKNARFTWTSSAFGEGGEGLKTIFKTLGFKEPDLNKLKEQPVTRDEATAFIAEVKLRAKGQLPDAIRSALLSANPRYFQNPGLELIEGWEQTFRTKGHPKAKGADFSISFPASWSKREGNRPNIIQVFRSGSGYGPIMCNLMVKDVTLPDGHKLTPEELKRFFQPDELKDMVPDGGIFIGAKPMVLEGAPAAMMVHDQTMQRLDQTLTVRMTQFITIQGSSMIFIQFAIVKTPDSTESLNELQKQYLPTYRAIANTFVFNDRYK